MAKDKEYEVLNISVLKYCKPQLKNLDINSDNLVVKLMHNHKLVEAKVEGTEDDDGELQWAVCRVTYLSD